MKKPAETNKAAGTKKTAEKKKAAGTKKTADTKKAAETKKPADTKKAAEIKKAAETKKSAETKKAAARKHAFKSRKEKARKQSAAKRLFAEGLEIKAEKREKKKEKAVRRSAKEIYTGKLVTNRKGFGFVEIEGFQEDIFISHSKLNGAFHKDLVNVELIPGRGHRQEGRIVKVLERGIREVIGTYRESRGFGFVIPDDQKIADDIHIARKESHGAAEGQKVVVRILHYGDEHHRPEGEITEVLGDAGDPKVGISSIVRSYELPEAFSKEVQALSEAVPLRIHAKELKGRKDLRDVQMVTIDGEDTKDLDDAVSLTTDGREYILGVHIADVSQYVKEGDALDREAYERGNSVYLADRVIPMLPERLSNGICSLNAGEDRLAMSCIMRISRSGILKEYEITESVINVDRRMTYTAVAGILDRDADLVREYKPLVPMLKKMATLSGILKRMRSKRGSIDFDLPESKIILDAAGNVEEIKAYERNAATGMIEQFMLSANETVAAHMLRLGYPFLYRIHEDPDADRMEDLLTLLAGFGYHVKRKTGKIRPVDVQALLAGMEGRPEEDLIRTLALRSMKQARYDVECVGHFGLAAKEYTHFTSPIRRYSDLQIHRILKEEMHGKLSKKRVAHYEKLLPAVAKQCSERERRAVDAERDTDKLLMAEYMQGHIGECYTGHISGVTGWGMYVQLPNTVEGMVPIAKMPGDDFDYSEQEYALVGRYTKKRYRLGEQVQITVAAADVVMRTIDFALVWEEEERDHEKRKKRSHKTRRK
ncbi:MAG: ribonuclease R [Lachnospiraceae bacterium]|nr:ribonuclease R [Lachnospiraceae bacterium]